MKKAVILTIVSLIYGIGAHAYDYTDDIYYNPKKDTAVKKTSGAASSRQSNLIDFSTIDVDEYNRRGQYYYTDIDTIGYGAENDADFVYTTQIQKFYNPTIVVDNANMLEDILNNSYGNIDIVYNYNGIPTFAPWSYSWPYYYSSWYSPWSWSFNIGPFGLGFGWSNPWWNWGPSWAWGPSWSWGPSWGWGWNRPVWGWGPNRPGWGPNPGPMATHSPGGRAPFGGRYTAPGPSGGNYAGSSGGNGGFGSAGRVPQSRPAQGVNSSGNSTRPSFNTGGRRESVGGSTSRPATTTTTRPSAPSTTTRPATTTRPGTTAPRSAGGRSSSTSTDSKSTTKSNSNNSTSTGRSSGSSRSTTTSRPASSGGSRSSFGGGGRSGGGFSGGGGAVRGGGRR